MTKSTRTAKPAKPYKDFPLFPHASGRWAKKVRGQFKYFGKVADDPNGQAALEKWREQKDDLLAGRTPRSKTGGLTIHELCDRFMVSRRNLLDSGELAAVTFKDYDATCRRIMDFFGKTRLVCDLAPQDFGQFRAAMAKGWSYVTLGNEIQRVRVVFHFAEKNHLLDGVIRWGTEFTKPSKKSLRVSRKDNGPRMFEAAELRSILDAASPQLKAMILLGINCGYGNADVFRLPIKALDLKAGWANFARPKTGIDRRCPLWPETIAAIKAALESRPAPRDPSDAGLVFLTRCGSPWGTREVIHPEEEGGKLASRMDDPVAKEFAKLLKRTRCPKCGRIEAAGATVCSACEWKPVEGSDWTSLHRVGLGFYALRHTFETIGGDSRDQVAVDAIMGHAPASGDMSATYRERIDDDRLQAVTEHVRKWLWPDSNETAAT